MGIFSDLSSQTYRGSKDMLRCEGPQQGHHQGEPQAPDSGRNCTSAGWSSGLHKGRCSQGLPTGTFDWEAASYWSYKHSQRLLQVQENALLSQNVTGCLPDEDGPHHGKVPRSDKHPRWHSGVDEDHDANLINLLNVAQIEGLVLNSKKLELKCPRVSFFGVEYSADGMHPCPKKIQGITEMTPPIDKQQLSSFIGMVTYMGNFVPHLSHHTEPLRAMLKQDVVFAWDEMANASFQKIKDLIAKSATKPLQYYDQRKPVTVQADASQRGLGTCLLQKGKPSLYASKSLTYTETRYANIERELLAIVFTCQQFNTYVLGRPFTVESDHKPLEIIHQKSLASAPPRLQWMLLQLQQYDVTIKYRPGKEMLLADAEQVPLTSFWGNQTGYESRLHCLQQGLDSQT